MRQIKLLKYTIPVIIAFLVCNNIYAKRKVTFIAEDGVTVTADLYFKDNNYPYVLLFHQDGSSRGEYNEIAEKIYNLNYNCLAVDLRYGDKMNFTENETALNARRNNIPHKIIDAEKDIVAAIEYVFKKSDTSVILFGSSSSASLCFKVALNNPRVKAVVTFGIGEYLKPDYLIADNIKNFYKPLFIATNKSEYPFVEEMISGKNMDNINVFIPANGMGEHGAKALWKPSVNSNEYWLALLMFFSKL